MKKFFFGFLATVFLTLNVNAQRPNLSLTPCPVGQHAVLSFEFNTLRFHRASAGCETRFSICSDGEWIIDCLDNSHRLSNYNSNDNTVKVVGEVSTDGNYLTLHFPIELTRLSGYVSNDFIDFGFDNDYYLTKDFSIEKGDYTPTFTNDEIIVKVNIK